MASYLRPRRGKKSTATSEGIILKKGEIFFEVPDTGVGTGEGKIKMGDGVTAYGSLPYFNIETPNIDNSVIGFTDTSTETAASNNATYLSNISPSNNVKTIFTNLKQLLYNHNAEITQLNNDIATTNNVLGAKNLLPNNIVSQTINGITITVNSDKSVTVSPGTVTEEIVLKLCTANELGKFPAGTYELTGCPSGGSLSTYYIVTDLKDSEAVKDLVDTGLGDIRTYISEVTAFTPENMAIKIKPGTVISSPITFYPMIRPVGIDSTYVPYAMPNLQITNSLNCIPISVQSDKSYEDIKFYRTGNVLKIYINGIKFVTGNQVICTVPDGFDLENNYAGEQQDYQFGDARLRFSIYDSQLSVYNYYSSDINDTNVRILLIF